MTPENKIANALHDIACCLAAIAGILFAMCITAHCTPLLPPLGYEIGEPPAPPPNPNVQYWHTQYVPGPQGVLPQEVFAPRLVAQVASEPQGVEVETPEPGPRAPLGIGLGCIVGYVYFTRKAQRKAGAIVWMKL